MFKNPLSLFNFNKNNDKITSDKSTNTSDKSTNTSDKITNANDKNFMENGTDILWEDTVEFTFPIKGGRVIKVYDADTITIASKLPFDASPMYRLSVRLNGIDTPEIKGKGISDEEKEAAKNARDFVSNMVLNKFVRLENIESETKRAEKSILGLQKNNYVILFDRNLKHYVKCYFHQDLLGCDQ